MEKLQPFSCLPARQFRCEKKYDIYFSDEKIYAKYRLISALSISKDVSPVSMYKTRTQDFSSIGLSCCLVYTELRFTDFTSGFCV